MTKLTMFELPPCDPGLRRLMDEHAERCRKAVDELYRTWAEKGMTAEQFARCRLATEVSEDGRTQTFWLEPIPPGCHDD